MNPRAQSPWNIDELYDVPSYSFTEECLVDGLKSLYYDGLDYKGWRTDVFAYYGCPDGPVPEGGWPAVVLVHGGGGTAFPQYVRWWNLHGFAAISMDIEGHLPGGDDQNRRPVNHPGPARSNVWDDIDKPIDEQWTYHAVGQVVKAHSLICSFPDINGMKTGIIGVSWGGIIACLTIGIDKRFKFAVPIYGCASLPDSDGLIGEELKKKTPGQLRRFADLWEGCTYLAKSELPVFWINGTNDLHFPLDAWQRSSASAAGYCLRHIEIRMEHTHESFIKNEALVFAKMIINGYSSFPSVNIINSFGKQMFLQVSGCSKIDKAELCYTRDHCRHAERIWESMPLAADELKGNKTIPFSLPEHSSAFFISIYMDGNFMLSSEYVEHT